MSDDNLPETRARKKFEAWARKERPDLDLRWMYDEQGNYHWHGYIWDETSKAWALWQAAQAEASERARAALAAQPVEPVAPEPPLIGRWHHGNGYLCSGSLRIAHADFDTNPPRAFQDNVFQWITDTLNAAVNRYEAVAPDEFAVATAAPIREQTAEPEPRGFIAQTNADYATWCRTFYRPDALDQRGMASLHGLWAWQEQERRKTAVPAAVAAERALWVTAARLAVEATPEQLPMALDALRDVLRAAPATEPAQQTADARDAALKALQELVRLKRIKARLDSPSIADLDSGALPSLREQYELLKPAAWERAFAAIDAAAGKEKPLGPA